VTILSPLVNNFYAKISRASVIRIVSHGTNDRVRYTPAIRASAQTLRRRCRSNKKNGRVRQATPFVPSKVSATPQCIIAARITGVRRAEPAILHGVIAWLVTIPMLLLLAALGATAMYGGWYGGLVAAPAWVATPPPMTPEMAAAMRNSALAAAVAMLLGLLGATLGGWMASGEPMTLRHYRRRTAEYERPRRAA